MARRTQVDPLSLIPSPDIVRERLDEVQRECDALSYLLDVAEEVARRRAESPANIQQAGQNHAS